MTITTLYEFNQRVFWIDIETGKVTSGIIQNIDIKVFSSFPVVLYRLKNSIGPLLPENRVFESKEALLQTL